jgi:small subunit ribosomal protein S27e
MNALQRKKEPESRFIKVRCHKCKNEQIIFGKCASKVKCLVCEKEIAESCGGKTIVKASILEVLD